MAKIVIETKDEGTVISLDGNSHELVRLIAEGSVEILRQTKKADVDIHDVFIPYAALMFKISDEDGVSINADLSALHNMEGGKLMQCIKIEPGKEPFLSEIDNTLEAMQAYVGGYIETVTCSNGLVVVVNEEGLFRNLPENGYLRLLHRAFRSPIYGNALVVRYAADIFMPVTKADLHPVMAAWQDGEAWKAGAQDG